jgi:hypothetical protein
MATKYIGRITEFTILEIEKEQKTKYITVQNSGLLVGFN